MKALYCSFAALFLFLCSSQAHAAESSDLVTSGPWAGRRIIAISSERVKPHVPAAQEGIPSVSTVSFGGVPLPADVQMLKRECLRQYQDTEARFEVFEFRVLSSEPNAFEWSCWAPAFPVPARFQFLSSTLGNRYFAFVGDGLQLFRVSRPRKARTIRKRFWEAAAGSSRGHPDALPSLPISQIHAAIGFDNTTALGPRSWNVVVLAVEDENDQLEIVVRGDSQEPKCKFRLIDDNWKLVVDSRD